MELNTQTGGGGIPRQSDVRSEGALAQYYIDANGVERPISQGGIHIVVGASADDYPKGVRASASVSDGATVTTSALQCNEEASSTMDAIYTGISVNPTGKTIEEQLTEYNKLSRAVGFPDQSHLHKPLSYLEEQAKRLAWKQLQREEEVSDLNLGEASWPSISTGPVSYHTAEISHSDFSTSSIEYHAAGDSDFSIDSTDYYTATSNQEKDSPYYTSPGDPSLASQIFETQKIGAIYIHDQGVNAAQSRGRLVLPVGAAANASPGSDSSVSTVDGFPDDSL